MNRVLVILFFVMIGLTVLISNEMKNEANLDLHVVELQISENTR